MALSGSNSGLRNAIYGKRLFTDTIKETLFFGASDESGGLMQKGSIDENVNAVLHIATDLKKEKGDTITVGIGAELTGTGVDGDAELEGNEEKFNLYSEAVVIGKRRNGVRLSGSLDDQKSAVPLRENAMTQLKRWGSTFMEQQVFLKLGGVTNTSLTDVAGRVVGGAALWSNTPDFIPDADEAAGTGARYLCANTGGTDALGTSDKLTPALISKAKTKAQIAKIRPIKYKGSSTYVMFVSPAQMYDLTENSTFINAQQYAGVRGSDNPLFKGGEVYFWQGVAIIPTEFVPFLDVSVAGNSFRGVATGTDCAVDCYRALLCGAQAAVWAEAENPNKWVEKKFDYEDKVGFATSIVGGVQKIMFNSKENGVIAVDTYATDFQ